MTSNSESVVLELKNEYMGWRRSNCFICLLIGLFVICTGLVEARGQALDKEAWEERKEGMNYEEQELEPQEPSTPPNPFLAPVILTILRIGGILLLSILLVFLIVKLVESTKNIKRPKQAVMDHETSVANLDVNMSFTDLRKEYENALQQERYRDAIGILFKIILKHLDSKGLLKAEIDKTNADYINEFPEGKLKTSFSNLSLMHEILWYGEVQFEKNDFERFAPSFMDFLEHVKSGS
jgi:hypothetical protein